LEKKEKFRRSRTETGEEDHFVSSIETSSLPGLHPVFGKKWGERKRVVRIALLKKKSLPPHARCARKKRTLITLVPRRPPAKVSYHREGKRNTICFSSGGSRETLSQLRLLSYSYSGKKILLLPAKGNKNISAVPKSLLSFWTGNRKK